jgi:hypothetical protein
MAVEIMTGRGVYRLLPAAPLEYDDSSIVLTLAMERADGIERVVTRCRITRKLAGEPPQADAIIERLKGWLAREFEATREAALKAIRSERRLHEILFDQANPGPFISH